MIRLIMNIKEGVSSIFEKLLSNDQHACWKVLIKDGLKIMKKIEESTTDSITCS